MAWQYTPYLIPLAVAAVVSIIAAFYLWRRSHFSGASALAWLLLAAAIWTLGYALELGSVALRAKIFWDNIQFLGISVISVAWLAFVFQFTGRQHWLTRFRLTWLSLVPVITLLLLFSNEAHHLFWRSATLNTDAPFSILEQTQGPALWVFLAYTYLALLLGVLMIAQVLRQTGQLYRGQATAILVAAFIPWLTNLLEALGLNPFPHFSLTPLAYTALVLLLAWRFHRLEREDIVPVAWESVISSIGDGVIVLNAALHILDLNPAAQDMIGLPASETIGQPLERVWPRLSYLFKLSDNDVRASREIELQQGNQRYIYEAHTYPLVDQRSHLISRVVVLHDITERKRSEAEIRARSEQQSALAKLGQQALSDTDPAALLGEVVSLVARTLKVEYVRLLKLIPDRDILQLQAGIGWQEELIGHTCLEAGTYTHEAGYTLRTGGPVTVTDFRRETRFHPSALLQNHQVVSSANVIIQGRQRPFGILGVDTTEPRVFNAEDIIFLEAIANVLTTVMDRQQTETEISRREQELLALQSAGAAITSSLNLEEALHTVAKAICTWLGVVGCAVSEWNQTDDTITTMVDYGPEGWTDKEEIGKVYHLTDYPLTEQVLTERRVQQMTLNQPAVNPAELAFMKETDINTLLLLPMIYQDRVIGLVEIMDDWAMRTFSDQEIALGQLLANQAASAIENARLFTETQRRLTEQSALREAIGTITSTLDLDAVLSHIAEQMGRAINATSAYICDYDPEAQTASVLAEYISPYASSNERISDLGSTYEDSNVEFLESLQRNQPTISHVDDPDLPQPEKEHMQLYDAQTILFIPLQLRGQIIGYAELWESRRKREFSAEEIGLCQDITQHAAIAIQNAELYKQAQQEVAERRRIEKQIQASLKEKEVMLQEIHHRVKNNLQVIASLLNLQSDYVLDEQAREVLQESQDRIRSMALIHDKLYRSENLAQIDFADYIQDLTNYLFRTQGAQVRGITLHVQIDNIFLEIDKAVPCGLILNELVTNSLKHAFPEVRSGEIRVEVLQKRDNEVIIVVGDNGVGFPPELDFRDTQSLGLQLVNTLVSQLDGAIELSCTTGTQFKIRFSHL